MKTSIDGQKQFERLLFATLPAVDEALQKSEVPIHDRAWRAAALLARHCLALRDSEGQRIDTADPAFILHPLFGPIFWASSRWYSRQYGASALPSVEVRHGLLWLRGGFFRLSVPLTVSRLCPKNGVVEVSFPLEMAADEMPMRLLEPRLNNRRLKRADRATIDMQCRDLGGQLRRLWNLIVPLSGPDPAMAELKASLLEHIDGAATRVTTTSSGARIGLAMMDLRLCSELTLKIHLLQEHETFERTHDFEILLPQASHSFREYFKAHLPQALRQYSKVNALRYGAGNTLGYKAYAQLYLETLPFLESLIRLLKRSMSFDGMAVTLREPVWASAGPHAFSWRSDVVRQKVVQAS